MIQRLQSLWLAGVLGLALLAAQSAMADVWYVNQAAAPGGNGTSWALAFQTIQPAIDAAAAAGGGEVWVTAGTYVETGDVPLSGALHVPDGVHVFGGFVGTESSPSQRVAGHATRIKVEHSPAPLHLLELGSNTVLDGIHVSGAVEAAIYCVGQSNVTLRDVKITGEDSPGTGTAMSWGLFVLDSSEITLSGCSIVSGQRLSAALLARSEDILLEGCEVSDNHVGISARRVRNLKISETSFRRNTAHSNWGGALALWGYYTLGSEYVYGVDVTNCVFEDNFSNASAAAAIDGRAAFAVRILKSRFFRNKVTDYSTPAIVIGWDTLGHDVSGGCNDLAPIVDQCLFVENETTKNYGGAISMPGMIDLEKRIIAGASQEKSYGPCSQGPDWEYFPTFISNCTFVRNKSAGGGSAVFMEGYFGEPPVSDCIFWENTVPAVVPDLESNFGWSAVVRSRVQEPHWGEFNYFEEPQFIDPENGDFRLAPGSPCIDYAPFYSGTDIDGIPRGLDGDGDGLLRQDTGAFEYVPPYHADQDRDGALSLSELLRLVQLYNLGGFHCAPETEDGFAPGSGNIACTPHASDHAPRDWSISLGELLRVIQVYNAGGYSPCISGEDGFCPGVA